MPRRDRCCSIWNGVDWRDKKKKEKTVSHSQARSSPGEQAGTRNKRAKERNPKSKTSSKRRFNGRDESRWEVRRRGGGKPTTRTGRIVVFVNNKEAHMERVWSV